MRTMLAQALNTSFSIDELEMRRFYQKYDGPDGLKFDEEFARLANQYDLVILGGGNFFEVWIDHSATGCTIDISTTVLDQIQTKVLFFGLGFDRYKGSSDQSLSRFLRFITHLHDRKNYLVSVRNDGSLAQLIGAYGDSVRNLIAVVPDGGFFVPPPDHVEPIFPDQAFNIVLSVAMDMGEVRFGTQQAQNGHRNLVDSLVRFVAAAATAIPCSHFTFMPHIYSDVRIVSEIVELLPDHIRRNRVSVGPCVSGAQAVDPVFVHYLRANCVIGMRFHASVCSVGFGTPSIGLSTYAKILDLYAELGLDDLVVDGRESDFSAPLLRLVARIHADPEAARKRVQVVRVSLLGHMEKFMAQVKEFVVG